jgi:hypothetical protein
MSEMGKDRGDHPPELAVKSVELPGAKGPVLLDLIALRSRSRARLGGPSAIREASTFSTSAEHARNAVANGTRFVCLAGAVCRRDAEPPETSLLSGVLAGKRREGLFDAWNTRAAG